MKFAQKVYNLLEKIPEGRITTYKVIGKKLNTEAYQAIGQILKQNPNAPKTPCHRVVSSDGSVGGYKGEKTGEAVEEKIKLLENEGIKIEDEKVKNFEKVLWR